MAIQRIVLDWSQPALTQVAGYLVGTTNPSDPIDLAGQIVVLPGARAGRRLLEILVDEADRQQRMLHPPRVVTVGQLPELLYAAKKPFASHFVQQLAWIEALRRCDAALCRQLLPVAPTEGDLPAALALGEMLGRLHRELAAEGLDFPAVARCGECLPGFGEKARWNALAELQQLYLRVLDELSLWDLQTARLYAIEHRECHIDAHIVLVGLVDLNRTQRRMLDQVADHVTVLVFASPDQSDRFDELGCLRSEAWQDAAIPLDGRRIEVVDSPADQAAAAVHAIAAYEGRYSSPDIVIGVPDEHVVPPLRQQLEQCGLRARYGAGLPLSRTGPYRLLQVVADYLESSRFTALASLVRHPAIHRWLSSQKVPGDWLSELDEYYAEHLPHNLDGRWPGAGPARAVLAQVHGAVDDLVRPLRGKAKPLADWAQPILDILIGVFDQGEFDRTKEPDRTVVSASHQICEALQDLADVPSNLMPSLTGSQAIRIVLNQLGMATVPPPPDHQAIELLGWLELPLDDSPAMIITGVDELIIPSSINSDLFLPNQLRRALQIEDNDRRCARDAYALSLLAASRTDLHLLAGRRNADGDPLTPSRLLFACADGELPARVKRFFKEQSAAASGAISLGIVRPGREHSGFDIPRPVPLGRRITSMRVTEFRDYLDCPYRYYLRHALNLQRVTDAADELDGGGFGSLAHWVLDQFGRNEIKESTDTQQIGAFLNAALDQRVKELFPTPLPAVLVQVEQLRLRLAALARWQADWARDGWRIEHVETDVTNGSASMVVDGEPMYLRGRIDRIDVNRSTGRRIVFDYKSSDSAKSPEQTHRSKDAWTDLQLPLYRHLVTALGIDGPVQLGYILLPKDISKVGPRMAEWSDDDLAAADRTAADVIRGVRAERFWPPADPPPAFSEDFSAICQDGRFGAVLAAEEEEKSRENGA
jgi:RecB family exonuclease